MGHCHYCRWISFSTIGSTPPGTFLNFCIAAITPRRASAAAGYGRSQTVKPCDRAAASLSLQPSTCRDSQPIAASSSTAREDAPSDCMRARSDRALHGLVGARCSQGELLAIRQESSALPPGNRVRSFHPCRCPCAALPLEWRYRSSAARCSASPENKAPATGEGIQFAQDFYGLPGEADDMRGPGLGHGVAPFRRVQVNVRSLMIELHFFRHYWQ
jgi:hypothetical protein